MPKVLLLPPPYVALQLPTGATPADGAVLALDLANQADRLLELYHWAERAPWCPVCVVLSTGQVSGRDLLHRAPYPDAWVPLSRPADGSFPAPSELVQAIRNRPIPMPAAIGAYVAHRRRRPALARYIAACARESSDPGHPAHIAERTLRERLREHALPGIRLWRRAFSVVHLLADDARGPGRTLERLAADHGLDARTVRGWCLRLTGLSAAEARALVGWEWVVESALEGGVALDVEDVG